MRHGFSLATLAVGIAHCSAIAVIGGFDRAGNWQFRGPADWPALALMSPVVVLLAGGLVSWGNRRLAGEWVVVAFGLSALVLYGVFRDYPEWRRTPPGRETQPMDAFLAMLLAWAVGLVLLLALIVRRLLAESRTGANWCQFNLRGRNMNRHQFPARILAGVRCQKTKSTRPRLARF